MCDRVVCIPWGQLLWTSNRQAFILTSRQNTLDFLNDLFAWIEIFSSEVCRMLWSACEFSMTGFQPTTLQHGLVEQCQCVPGKELLACNIMTLFNSDQHAAWFVGSVAGHASNPRLGSCVCESNHRYKLLLICWRWVLVAYDPFLTTGYHSNQPLNVACT